MKSRINQYLRATAVAVAAMLALTACPTEPEEAAPTPEPTPAETPEETPEESPTPVRVPPLELQRIGSFQQPLGVATRSDDPALYIVEKTGRVIRFEGGDTSTVLDLRGSVSRGSEQGLLGLAFSPDGARMYVNYTDTTGDTRVVEYRFEQGRATGRRELMRIAQPFTNHNGGMLAFGPDGMLYISTGDGGSGGDPQDNAQSLDNLLGKILRIDPAPSGDRPYTIPADNPFVGRAGRDEIWAYGLRNPWRFSFDRATGDLWIADVGQRTREEINHQPADSPGGENYGWNRMEGTHRFNPPPPDDHVLPIYDYARTGGNCAVTGGYVYRGERIPALQGWYIFGDFCLGRVIRLRLRADGEVVVRETDMRTSNLSSFGEGPDGAVYVISLDGPVYRIRAAS